MKKLSKLIVVLGLGGSLVTTSMAAAPIKIQYNEENLELNQEPILKEERVLLPLREVAQHLNYEVKWNDKKKEIILYNEETQIKLIIDSKVAEVNGRNQMLDVPAQIIDEVTFVPLRFITEAFKKEVTWYKDQKIIAIKDTAEYVVDSKNKKLLYKENGFNQVIGDVRINQLGSLYIDNQETPKGNQVITVDNNYGEPSVVWDRTTFYIKDGEVIKRTEATYKNRVVQDVQYFDNRVALTDSKKVYVYNEETGQLTRTYELEKLLGKGIYQVEGVGERFVVVREQNKGLLTLVTADSEQVIEIYDEILPNKKEKDFALAAYNPVYDGIKLVKKEGNTLYFSYSGLEIKNGKFAYYLKK